MENMLLKPLREHDDEVRTAVYRRLGLSAGWEHEHEVQAQELWCRHCGNRFPVGSIRLESAPGPQWFEPVCPGRLADDHCEGSWEDFRRGPAAAGGAGTPAQLA